MVKFNRTGGKSNRSQRGQAMLESSLIIIPLFAILCAIIDFSMAVFARNSLILDDLQDAFDQVAAEVSRLPK